MKFICKECGKEFIGKKTNRKYCTLRCSANSQKRLKRPEVSKRQRENNVSKRPEVRKKISEARIRYFAKGDHPANYIDGSSRNRKYRLGRWLKLIKEIYKRDNFTCQTCGKHGGLLNAHHILPLAGNPELAFDEDNIVTLCVPCHSRLHMIEKGALCKSQEVSHENSNFI